MKKKVFAIALIITSIFMTGCTKEPLSSEEFKTVMSEKSYIVTNTTDLVKTNFLGIEESYYAQKEDESYTIEYYLFSSSFEAESFYLIKQRELQNSGVTSKSETTMNNYIKYTQTHNGKYSLISKVSNTAIYVTADITHKEEIKNLIKELGY